MQVLLTPELEALVRRKVDSGLYSDASEVVRDALRFMAERDELTKLKLDRLRDALVAGEQSPLVDDYDIERIIGELDAEQRETT